MCQCNGQNKGSNFQTGNLFKIHWWRMFSGQQKYPKQEDFQEPFFGGAVSYFDTVWKCLELCSIIGP